MADLNFFTIFPNLSPFPNLHFLLVPSCSFLLVPSCSFLLTQHAFDGVFPYQLKSASDHLHTLLSQQPLIHNWVPTPPDLTRVDSALRVVTRRTTTTDDDTLIGNSLFRQWVLQLYTDAVLSGASKAVNLRVPVGVASIAGIGAVSRAAPQFVGTAIGVYSLGVVVSIFLGLSG